MSGVASMSVRAAGPALPVEPDRVAGRGPDPLATVELFGFRFVSADLTSVVDRLVAPQPDDELLPIVLTPNVDYIVRLAEPALASIRADLQRSRWVLPDGQPLFGSSKTLRGLVVAVAVTGAVG